jgi:L-rhamnose-H+ transport protein
MQENIISGFVFVVVAGIFAGAFALPMKFTTNWKWQHNWIVFSTWALLIIPAITALITVPHITAVYQDADTGIILKVFLFGLAWGFGVICFGLGLDYLGVALGMSVMLGLLISLGAIMPIVIYQPEELFSPKGYKIMIASAIILVGITTCAFAGSLREKKNSLTVGAMRNNRSKFYKGLIIAILAGILSVMQNVGFVTGRPIQDIAIQSGANPVFAGNAVWPVLMAGCFLVNFLYCGYLIFRDKEWPLLLTAKKWYWPAVTASGFMWFLCMLFFGMAAAKLGKLGPSIGWASFQTLAVVTGNIAGLLTGEWDNAGTKLRIVNFAGIAILLVGIVVMAF